METVLLGPRSWMRRVPHTTTEMNCKDRSISSTTVRHFLIVTFDLKLGHTYSALSVLAPRLMPCPCHVYMFDQYDAKQPSGQSFKSQPSVYGLDHVPVGGMEGIPGGSSGGVGGGVGGSGSGGSVGGGNGGWATLTNSVSVELDKPRSPVMVSIELVDRDITHARTIPRYSPAN